MAKFVTKKAQPRVRHATKLARVTLGQISAACGLPLMTVSRALRGKTREVNERDLALAVETARRLGYRPNLMNHALRTGRRQLIGVVAPVLDAYLHALVAGIHDHLTTHEALPCLHLVPPAADPAAGYRAGIAAALDRQVDGLIVLPPPGAQAVLDQLPGILGQRRIPVAVLGLHPLSLAAAHADVDPAAALRLWAGACAGWSRILLLASTRWAPHQQALALALGAHLGLPVHDLEEPPTPTDLTRLAPAGHGDLLVVSTVPGFVPALRGVMIPGVPPLRILTVGAAGEMIDGFPADQVLGLDAGALGRALAELVVDQAYHGATPRTILLSPTLTPSPF